MTKPFNNCDGSCSMGRCLCSGLRSPLPSHHCCSHGKWFVATNYHLELERCVDWKNDKDYHFSINSIVIICHNWWTLLVLVVVCSCQWSGLKTWNPVDCHPASPRREFHSLGFLSSRWRWLTIFLVLIEMFLRRNGLAGHDGSDDLLLDSAAFSGL